MDQASHFLSRIHSLLYVLSQKSFRRYPAVMRITQAFLAALKSLSRLHKLFATWCIRFLVPVKSISVPAVWKSPDEFCHEIVGLLGSALEPKALLDLSVGLQKQYLVALRSNPNCMLPSYNHQLPHGQEIGTYLALDVGGSTFRVALIELVGNNGDGGTRILSLRSFKINNSIKQLKGNAFFDWMALKIDETISGDEHEVADGVLSMGLAWSFPIEQTSLRSGTLQNMGKGFLAADGLIGRDLGDVLQQACSRRNLNVCLKAIVNDSTATLLSNSYADTSTRFGLILGTGVNLAVHLPVSCLGLRKYGIRPASWHDVAKHVIVNTELGMFGKNVLPMTPWDVELNAEHAMPDFQPLEHFLGGRYLGEIARLILLDGVRQVGLFEGIVPTGLDEPYAFECELLSNVQSSTTLQEARDIFSSQHPTANSPSDTDMKVLKLIAQQVSKRASAILAASVHALWRLRIEAESEAQGLTSRPDFEEHTMMNYSGSVIEHYPDFRTNCESFLNMLIISTGGKAGALGLASTKESTLLGAAVAVACIDDEERRS